jgi:hypothetical protein
LDGNAITNVDTVINEATGEEGIKITYPHSTHVIEITGGSVVSDFQSINGTNSSTTVIGTTGANNSAGGE